MTVKQILILPGDGIGPEIMMQAEKVLQCLIADHGLTIAIKKGLIGGSAYDEAGVPLPDETLSLARQSDAILLGAVGGPKWDCVAYSLRPEQGLLAIRAAIELFSNLRPAVLYEPLAHASSLKPEVITGLDLMIVRELTGGIYFGVPRGIHEKQDGKRQGINTLVYDEYEIERVARVAFEIATKRRKKVCSVDKANVLEATELWRQVVTKVAADYPHVDLQHMYVDNAAMQLVRAPKQFDVLLTTNMFGDILSDLAAMLTGSIGMLPSASLGYNQRGMYEPAHGAAPDIAGKNSANPIATILSVAMMLRYSLNEIGLANKVEKAIKAVLAKGFRTADIYTEGMQQLSTEAMGDMILAELK